MDRPLEPDGEPRVTIQRRPSMLLAGFSFFGDPFHSHAGWTEENEIGRLWQRLLAYRERFAEVFPGQAPPEVMFEVHVQQAETAASGEFEVFVGFETGAVEALPVELCAKVLPAADYAVFTLRGAQIEQDEPIIDDWLQAHSYRVAQPVFIQRYDRRYKGLERLEESEIDFLLPVVRADETDARA